MNDMIKNKINPVRILVRKVTDTESTLIMIEGTKAIKNLAKTEEVIRSLQREKDLLNIFKSKFKVSDS